MRHTFSEDFFRPTTNAQLVPKFHAARRACPEALPMLTPQFLSDLAFPMLIRKIPVECSNTPTILCFTSFLTLPSPFPNALSSFQSTFTRRMSGHCMGIFTPRKCLHFLPLSVVCLTPWLFPLFVLYKGLK
jgi:hypothetical protein